MATVKWQPESLGEKLDAKRCALGWKNLEISIGRSDSKHSACNFHICPLHTILCWVHSIWHLFYSVWQTVWHVLWHSFKHSIKNLFWFFWHLFQALVLAFYLASIRHLFWQKFWHSIWYLHAREFKTCWKARPGWNVLICGMLATYTRKQRSIAQKIIQKASPHLDTKCCAK